MNNETDSGVKEYCILVCVCVVVAVTVLYFSHGGSW